MGFALKIVYNVFKLLLTNVNILNAIEDPTATQQMQRSDATATGKREESNSNTHSLASSDFNATINEHHP